MSRYLRRLRRLLRFSVTGFTIFSVSVGLIPLLGFFPPVTERILSYCVAALFWGGCLLGSLSFLLFSRFLRRRKKRMLAEGTIREPRGIGIFSFTGKPSRWILYGCCVLGTLFLILNTAFGFAPEDLMFPVISIVLFTFSIHCIADGKNYKLYQAIKKGNGSYEQ